MQRVGRPRNHQPTWTRKRGPEPGITEPLHSYVGSFVPTGKPEQQELKLRPGVFVRVRRCPTADSVGDDRDGPPEPPTTKKAGHGWLQNDCLRHENVQQAPPDPKGAGIQDRHRAPSGQAELTSYSRRLGDEVVEHENRPTAREA